MNPLLPRLEGEGYDGRAARIFLGLMPPHNIRPALNPRYLPNGVADLITDLEISTRRKSMMGLFAWIIATQFP